jgi:hypothetical protein
MSELPRRQDYLLSDAMKSVWYHDRKSLAEGVLYIPSLNYIQMAHQVSELRLSGRTEAGERWPEEINACLRRLTTGVRSPLDGDTENEERIGVENALSKLREAQAAFEEHGLPEPKLLTLLQIDLTRVRNELDPGQSPDRPR